MKTILNLVSEFLMEQTKYVIDSNYNDTVFLKMQEILHADQRQKQIEPGNYSLSAYEVSKKVIHFLRHSQKTQREDDGAVHFWRILEHLQS